MEAGNLGRFDIEADEIEIFGQDVDEHLQTIEAGVLWLEQEQMQGQRQSGDADPETLDAIFRAAHTLKATAGTVGHQEMADLTHSLETLFVAMRQEQLAPTQEVIDDLLAAVDSLRVMRDEVVTGQPSGLEVTALLARLRSSAGGEAEEAAEEAPSPTLEQAARLQATALVEEGHRLLEVQISISAESFSPAARLLQATMALADEGQIVAQNPADEDLLEGRQAGQLWLVLATQNEAEEIERQIADLSEVQKYQIRPYDPEQAARPAPAKGRSEQRSRPHRRGAQDGDQTVRISVERLDALMDLVGEMVTDRTRLEQSKEFLQARYGKGDGLSVLGETVAHVGQIIDQLQDEVMQARMVPIASLFDKFPRLVRDLARDEGKQVHLVLDGEATELDRSVIEAIGDPLVHLLRNAVDHGIELPKARVAAGKPATGTIQLTAEHAEGQIILTVMDDGLGIDAEQIRRSAVKRDLLSEEDAKQMGEDEILSLIFRPGLSTTEKVTEVSGRGVGLDVVRTNIGRIGGSVAVESQVGQGTIFRLTLPLTLAIVQTMLVAVGQEIYAIPLTGIVESLYLQDVTMHSVKGSPAIQWRERVLPLLSMRQAFPSPHSKAQEQPQTGAVVVATWGKLQTGLIVDRILGQQEIVVKPFGPFIGNVPGLAGCTILGDGTLALIVDVPGLMNMTIQARSQKTRKMAKQEVL